MVIYHGKISKTSPEQQIQVYIVDGKIPFLPMGIPIMGYINHHFLVDEFIPKGNHLKNSPNLNLHQVSYPPKTWEKINDPYNGYILDLPPTQDASGK